MKKIMRYSRRLLAGVLALAVLLSLAACQPEPDNEQQGPTADELARAAVTASGWNPDGVERLADVLNNADIAVYVANYYGVEESAWTECAVYRAGGAEAFEIAVLRLKDEAGAQAAAESLKQYIQGRKGAFVGYLPAQADIVSQSLAVSQGIYAALLICENPEAARDAFFAVLNGEEPTGTLPPPPPPTEDLPPQEMVGPTADDGALAILSALKLESDTLDRIDTGLSEADYSAKLAELGLAEDAVEEMAWYQLDDGFQGGRYLEVYTFRLTEGTANGTVENALKDCGGERSREARDGYVASDGQEGMLLCYVASARKGYAELVIGNFNVRQYIQTSDENWVLNNTNFLMEFYFTCLGEDYDPSLMIGTKISSVLPTDGGLSTPAVDPATGRIPYVNPEQEDMTVYDTSAILAAWAKKDPSRLSAYDRAIYDAAVRVLGETITEDMTDYEKEYTLYMWVITNLEYDYNYQDTLATADRASYTPYGGLVNRKGICLGFASTFQLLMDMAGVECITVVGAAENSTEDHAWNQVRLDGEWYCVDPTWDYGYYPTLGHLYWFNHTSDFFADTMPNHQWDYAGVPEATGTKYAVS